MKRSTDRILTTHVGSLIRPKPLLDAGKADRARHEELLTQSVADIVARQAKAGIDVVNDGEFGKSGWANYALERMTGFEPRPDTLYPAVWLGRDRDALRRLHGGGVPARRDRHAGACLRRPDRLSAAHASVRRDLANLKAAAAAAPVEEAFFTAVAPASVGYDARNEYYANERDYVFAIADALREEYLEIHKAGRGAAGRRRGARQHVRPSGRARARRRYREWAELRVEALNHALEGIPEDRIRYHVCFGSWHVPHVADAPLEDIVDLILQVRAGAYSIEAANVRHEHEWRVWQKVKLPPDKILIPGVVTHHTTTVEHPRLVADRIVQFRQAGRARERHRRHRLRLRAGRDDPARPPAGDVGQVRERWPRARGSPARSCGASGAPAGRPLGRNPARAGSARLRQKCRHYDCTLFLPCDRDVTLGATKNGRGETSVSQHAPMRVATPDGVSRFGRRMGQSGRARRSCSSPARRNRCCRSTGKPTARWRAISASSPTICAGTGCPTSRRDPACYQDGRRWADELAAVIAAKRPAPAGAGRLVARRARAAPVPDALRRRRAERHQFPGHAADRGPGRRRSRVEGVCTATRRAILRAASRRTSRSCAPATRSSRTRRISSRRSPTTSWCRWRSATRSAAGRPIRTLVRKAFAAITVPTLVTHGRRDRLILPAAAEMTAAAIKGATVSLYDDCGHAPFYEDAGALQSRACGFRRESMESTRWTDVGPPAAWRRAARSRHRRVPGGDHRRAGRRRDRDPVRRHSGALRVPSSAGVVGRARLDPVPLARRARQRARVPPGREPAHDDAGEQAGARQRSALFEAIALAASLAFLAMILPASIEHVELEAVVMTPTLDLSMTWRTLAMPIGIGLMIVLGLLRLLDQPRREMLQALVLVARDLRAAVARQAVAARARQAQPRHLLPGGRAVDGVRRHSDRVQLRHGDVRLSGARDARSRPRCWSRGSMPACRISSCCRSRCSCSSAC